jgi:uncharacterized repeat protein (TIGR01451 family)
MKPQTTNPILRRAARAAVLLAAIAVLPSAAAASTAANTQITNTATVRFNDAGGVAQTPVTAQATVTVTLVPAAVALTSPGPVTTAQGTPADLSYTITGNANGWDTYDVTATATASNLTGVTVTPFTVVLGGTTLAAPANTGDTSITVPYDGAADGQVNRIAVGDLVVVGANAYTVSSVTENAGTNTAVLGLDAAIAGASVGAGQIVGERQVITVSVPSGTVVVAGTSSGTQTVSTTATSQSGARPATTQTTPTVVTVNRALLTVTKLVSTDGGATFLASASAAPGATLTYKITASNTGSTPALAVSFTDQIPQYLAYQNGTARFSTTATDDYAAAAGNALTEGSGGYGYDAGTTTVSYTGASIPGGAALVLFYQAKID